MTAFNFGVGTAIGRRTDVANNKPSFLGVLQDLQIDIDVTLKELVGQYKMPVDVAPATLKVTGKAKFARIQGSSVNNLLLGQTLTEAAGIDMSSAEAGTIPAPSGPYTITVTNSATFLEDMGVFYALTGKQLQPVASGPTVGQYSVSAGVYTFAAADASLGVLIYYNYTVSTLSQIALANQLMGTGPVFSFTAQNSYVVGGVTKKLILKLNACRGSKWSFPFKNVDYTIQDFEFTAFADAANNWGTWAFAE